MINPKHLNALKNSVDEGNFEEVNLVGEGRMSLIYEYIVKIEDECNVYYRAEIACDPECNFDFEEDEWNQCKRVQTISYKWEEVN